MGLSVKATFKPPRELQAVLSKMRAPGLNRVLAKGLIASAELVSNEITERQILRGGRRKVKGPRGGTKMVSAPANARQVTSRSGTLRLSLGTSYGINKSGIPKFIEVGSDLEYAAAHEYGATIRVTDAMRAALHYVGIHLRKSTTILNIPPRPFMRPGFEKVEPRFPSLFVKFWRQEIGT